MLATGVHLIEEIHPPFFRSICTAAICLSDSQSPVSINCLSSALRKSYSTTSHHQHHFHLLTTRYHFPLLPSVTTIWQRCFALAMPPLDSLWGWSVSLSSADSEQLLHNLLCQVQVSLKGFKVPFSIASVENTMLTSANKEECRKKKWITTKVYKLQ